MNLIKVVTFVSAVAGVTGVCVAPGCSSNTPATPRVALNSQLGPGDEDGVNKGPQCQLTTQPWVVIGDNQHPVSDGEQQTGSTVSVSCNVKGNATDGYEVSGQATLAGKGSVTLTGHFTDSGDQTNIRAVFTQGETGSFKQNDCTVTYASNPNMGIAAGRVWGAMTCPHAFYESQTRTCLGTAEFRFENCGQ